MVWPLIAGLMGAGGAVGLAGSLIGGLGSLAGGVVSGLGSLGGGLLSGAGSMLSGGGGRAVAPSFGAQPFAGGAPLALPAPEASRALIPAGGGGGELDAAMGGALTVQQLQQDSMVGLLQQIASTVGVIAQNTAGLIGIETAQMSAQQEAIDDQRTELALKGGETDDTTKESGRRWFSNPLGSAGMKLLDFARKPLPMALGLFGLWWWLRNNMDVFEKVLVPILRFFKNLQEDPEGTWKSLKETVKTFAADSFNKIGHAMGNSVLDIFGFQFKDDNSWDIIAKPGETWDTLNPFTGKITFWTALIDVVNLLLAGRWPDGSKEGKKIFPDWMYGTLLPEDPLFQGAKDAGFWASLLNLVNLKWPDGTSMMPFMDTDAPWREEMKANEETFITKFKKDMFGLMETNWFEKVDHFMKNDFRVFMENLVPSKETLAKMAPDVDWKGMLDNFTKFIYDKGPPEKFMNMDISVLNNALPSITDIKQAWNKFWPGTLLDFKDVRTTEAGKWGGGSMIGAEAGVQERANKIADLKSKLALELKKPPEGSGFWSDDQSPEKIAQLESELTRLGVPPIVNAIDIGASTKTLQTVTRQADEATGKFNSMPVVIDSSTKSSTTIANSITQADLSGVNDEWSKIRAIMTGIGPYRQQGIY